MELKSIERHSSGFEIEDPEQWIREKGEVAYFCPHCNEINKVNIDYNIKTIGKTKAVVFKVVLTIICNKCNKEFDVDDPGIDPNILDAVIRLNKAGYITDYSCEGHDYENDIISCPYISFIDKTIMKHGTPEDWIYKKYNDCDCIGLYYDKYLKNFDNENYHFDKEKALTQLYEWLDKFC